MVENSNDLIAFKATRRSRWIYTPYYCAFHTRNLKFKSCLHNCVFLKSAVKRCFLNCIKRGEWRAEKIHLFWSLWYMVENWNECILSTEADQHAYLRQSAVRKSRGLERLNPNRIYVLHISRSWNMLLISI